MIFALLLAFFDRLRGSGWFRFNKTIGSMLMGLTMAMLIGKAGWISLYAVAATFAGTKFNLRELENVFDRKGSLWELCKRGLLWGGFLLPVSPLAAIASFIGFVSSPYWARALPYKGDKWAIMEFGRSLTTGLIIIGLS